VRFPTVETYLESAREHVQEILRLETEYRLMSVIFAYFAVEDLLDLDVG
tara:strand:+ start:23670 stop:23816 length:147 start_codon:yes stop_codon:yes gene_type:complete